MSMNRAISYARFSSQRQAGGTSIARQLKLTRDYCEAHSLILDESLTDEGLSAFKGDHTARGNLGRFYEALHAGMVERGTYLIVEALDRLSREGVRPALAQLLHLIDAGIKIVTLFDGHIYEEASKSVELDLITAILYMSEAHKASASKSRRLTEAWTIKRTASVPLTRMCPAWLSTRNDASGIAFEPNEGANIVRRIFQDVASGLGCYSVAVQLNAKGIPPLTGDKKHGDKLSNGNPNPKAGQSLSQGWNKGRIAALIKSDSPLGWFQPHKRVGKDRVPVGEPIRDYYPAIITQAVADKARASLAGRTFSGVGSGRKGEVISNLFTGVAKCECGASMVLMNRQAARGYSGWLRCSVALHSPNVCSNVTGIHYGKFEEAVIRDFGIITHIIMASPRDDKSKEIAETLAGKKAEAEHLKKRIDEISSAFGDVSFAVIADQMRSMAERYQMLSDEITILDRQLLIARQSTDVNDLEKQYIIERIDSADRAIVQKARAELSMMIRKLFKDRIICQSDGTVVAATSSVGEIRYKSTKPIRKIDNESEWISSHLEEEPQDYVQYGNRQASIGGFDASIWFADRKLTDLSELRSEVYTDGHVDPSRLAEALAELKKESMR